MIHNHTRLAGALLALGLLMGAGIAAAAAAGMDDLLARYAGGGAGPFDIRAGQKLFTATHNAAKKPRKRSCTQCHTRDLTAPGKHLRTGKRIAPMAPSVNPERFTDSRKIAKWLRRNCKWTLGRTCSPQEKGDLLTFFKSQ